MVMMKPQGERANVEKYSCASSCNISFIQDLSFYGLFVIFSDFYIYAFCFSMFVIERFSVVSFCVCVCLLPSTRVETRFLSFSDLWVLQCNTLGKII